MATNGRRRLSMCLSVTYLACRGDEEIKLLDSLNSDSHLL